MKKTPKRNLNLLNVFSELVIIAVWVVLGS
jgi:hypothetical protein